MKRIASFKYAFAGILTFFRKDPNGQLHLLAAVLVTAAGIWLHISYEKWLAVLLCIGLVISTEMINTAIEKLCDTIHPDYHPQIKTVKDIAAGAVLLSAVVSLIIGIIIFLPEIRSLF